MVGLAVEQRDEADKARRLGDVTVRTFDTKITTVCNRRTAPRFLDCGRPQPTWIVIGTKLTPALATI